MIRYPGNGRIGGGTDAADLEAVRGKIFRPAGIHPGKIRQIWQRKDTPAEYRLGNYISVKMYRLGIMHNKEFVKCE